MGRAKHWCKRLGVWHTLGLRCGKTTSEVGLCKLWMCNQHRAPDRAPSRTGVHNCRQKLVPHIFHMTLFVSECRGVHQSITKCYISAQLSQFRLILTTEQARALGGPPETVGKIYLYIFFYFLCWKIHETYSGRSSFSDFLYGTSSVSKN